MRRTAWIAGASVTGAVVVLTAVDFAAFRGEGKTTRPGPYGPGWEWRQQTVERMEDASRLEWLMDRALDSLVSELRPLSFSAFYRQYRKAVYRPLAIALRDPDMAAEAVDEAMVRAFERWSVVQRVDNQAGWVYRVAYRWAIDRMRRRDVERRALAILKPTAQEARPDPEPFLHPALARLPIEQRAVVVLAVAFEWSEKEIAEVLGIRPGTVKSRLHRGLASLRKELGS